MPELPEVETVMRGLVPHLLGRTIVRLEARRPDLRQPLPPDLAARVAGRRVDALTRRAKYILLRLAPRATGEAVEFLLLHLGMSGRLVVGRADGHVRGPHEHVVFATDAGAEIRFSDPRRFGMVDLVPAAGLADDARFAGLGPEPLSDTFDAPALAAAFAGSRTAVKLALLDQRRLAGVGNIYACEALFRAGISPLRRAGSVAGARAERLVAAVKAVLADAIEAGGSSARDYVQASGEAGWFQNRWAVYDREGKPCPGCDCDGGVRRIVQGARSTFYCPRRQR